MISHSSQALIFDSISFWVASWINFQKLSTIKFHWEKKTSATRFFNHVASRLRLVQLNHPSNWIWSHHSNEIMYRQIIAMVSTSSGKISSSVIAWYCVWSWQCVRKYEFVKICRVVWVWTYNTATVVYNAPKCDTYPNRNTNNKRDGVSDTAGFCVNKYQYVRSFRFVIAVIIARRQCWSAKD